MAEPLVTMWQLFDELATIDLTVMSTDQLGALAIQLGQGIDRLTAYHGKVVHAADERRAWAGDGARDVEEWLSNKTGTSKGQAKSRKRLGEALERSKTLDDAVNDGELSAAAAEQLHDAIVNPPPGTDESDVDDLIDAAKGSKPHEARQAADRWREIHSNETPEERSARRFAKRSLTSKPASDGLVESTLVLPETEHRQVMNAINAAAGNHLEGDDRTHAQRMADGLIQLGKAYAAGTVTGGRERATLLIGATAETMAGLSDEPGWTSYGDRIPADVLRVLAENAIIRRIVHAGNTIIELGDKVRFATDAQFQALMMRDGGCRVDQCSIPAAWCEVDHLVPVSEGGTSDLINMALLCSHHHHLKHAPGVQVIGDALHFQLRLPNGRVIDCPTKGIHTRRTQAAA
ncbi:MAG: DUF222 domain-containing protein [Acidimicrobiales bacterium]